MRVFYASGFPGVWLSLTAAIVVAETQDDARRLLTAELNAKGLEPEFTLFEMPTDEAKAIVLVDGDY